jgi:hypothetical protein
VSDVATGHGIELSFTAYPPRRWAFVGAFAQMQRFWSFRGDHMRYALGGEAGWTMFSVEAGLACRTADDSRASTLQLHLGAIMALVFLNTGVQVGVPMVSLGGSRPMYPVEASFVMAVKVPILLE